MTRNFVFAIILVFHIYLTCFLFPDDVTNSKNKENNSNEK